MSARGAGSERVTCIMHRETVEGVVFHLTGMNGAEIERDAGGKG